MEFSDDDIRKLVKGIRDHIYGVSDQFMDDVKVIYDKFRNIMMIPDDMTYCLVSETPRSNTAGITNLIYVKFRFLSNFLNICFYK